MSSNPLRDTPEWRRARQWVYDTYTHCAWCARYIEHPLPRWHPHGRTADHIIELADGGDLTDPRNLQLLCRSCNARKSNYSRQARKRGGRYVMPGNEAAVTALLLGQRTQSRDW